jgi:hypothetical protein
LEKVQGGLLELRLILRERKRKYWDTSVRESFVGVFFATTSISLFFIGGNWSFLLASNNQV